METDESNTIDFGQLQASFNYPQKDTPIVEELNLHFPAGSKWQVKAATLKPTGEELISNKKHLAWKGKPGSVLRLKAYSTAYAGGFNSWHMAIILAFFATGVCLFSARKKINLWHLNQEEKKLQKLQTVIFHEAADEDLADYYQPFNLILNSRLKEAKHFAKGK